MTERLSKEAQEKLEEIIRLMMQLPKLHSFAFESGDKEFIITRVK